MTAQLSMQGSLGEAETENFRRLFAGLSKAEPVLQTEERVHARAWRHVIEVFTETNQFDVAGVFIRCEGGWKEKLLKQPTVFRCGYICSCKRV